MYHVLKPSKYYVHNLQNYVVKAPPNSHTHKKSSLILNSTKQLHILSYSASRFNFEDKMGEAAQNNIQVNSPSGMLWHWLKLVC